MSSILYAVFSRIQRCIHLSRLSMLALVVLAAWYPGAALAQLDRAAIVKMQEQAVDEGWTFEVGENDATKYPLEQLCGLKEPEGWRTRARFDPIATSSSDSPLPSAFDWRTYNGCTPIRNQGSCGSCWAFSTVGAMECAIKIREGKTVDLSEQWLLSCNHDGWDCDGGWYAHSYHGWATDGCGGTGAVPETAFPYVGWEKPCACPYPHEYWINSWAYIDGGVEGMKRAIIEYGPISVSVYVNSAFQAYQNGVFSYSTSGTINHAVVLIGWDDSQGEDGIWIMRNSWGSGWGEGGYMRIAYGCCQIGYAACYVDYRPVRIACQNEFGMVPLTTSFQPEVAGSTVTGCTWEFGDGEVSNDVNPTHVYSAPGCYSVKLTVNTPDGDLYKMSPNLVSVHADTLSGSAVEILSGGSVRMDVSARNFVPIQKLTIPFTWDGPFHLRYDSSSVTGARTAYFDYITTVSWDPDNSRAALVLRAGNQPALTAGEGLVVSLWFTAGSGLTGVNQVAFTAFGYYSPSFESAANVYQPALSAGYFFKDVSAGCCQVRVGDVDQNGEDEPTLGDVMTLVDHLFISGNPLGCVEEADIDQSGSTVPTHDDISLGDVMLLVDYLFINGRPLKECR